MLNVRTRTFVLPGVLLLGAGMMARASNVICTLTPGNSLTQTAEPCGQAMFATTDFLDWGQPQSSTGYSGFGDASSAPAGR